MYLTRKLFTQLGLFPTPNPKKTKNMLKIRVQLSSDVCLQAKKARFKTGCGIQRKIFTCMQNFQIDGCNVNQN